MTTIKEIIPERCIWRVAIETFPDVERHKDMKCYFCRGYKTSAERMNCTAYYPYQKMPINGQQGFTHSPFPADIIDLWDEKRMLHRPNDYEDDV